VRFEASPRVVDKRTGFGYFKMGDIVPRQLKERKSHLAISEELLGMRKYRAVSHLLCKGTRIIKGGG
jgi:hypothetical protein